MSFNEHDMNLRRKLVSRSGIQLPWQPQPLSPSRTGSDSSDTHTLTGVGLYHRVTGKGGIYRIYHHWSSPGRKEGVWNNIWH